MNTISRTTTMPMAAINIANHAKIKNNNRELTTKTLIQY